jgi:hypothetical protein
VTEKQFFWHAEGFGDSPAPPGMRRPEPALDDTQIRGGNAGEHRDAGDAPAAPETLFSQPQCRSCRSCRLHHRDSIVYHVVNTVQHGYRVRHISYEGRAHQW